jgi:membrane-associated phospholipid phosphatase
MTQTTRSAAINALAAIVLFGLFFALGGCVVRHGEPAALWTFAKEVRGHALGLAWAFTNAGWAQVLAPLYAICLIVAAVNKRWRVRSLSVVAVALVSWGLADGFQHFFARPRRGDWLIRHEHAFSYPSSHAAIATGFYFLWGVVLLRSELPRRLRYASFAVLTGFTLGIVWSRLSLAAHYPTDVLGGILLGLVVSLLAAAAVKVLAVPGSAT